MWKVGLGRAGLLLATTGLLKGGGFEENHHFCLLCLVCIQFRTLHFWQTCNMACSSRRQVGMRRGHPHEVAHQSRSVCLSVL